MTSCNIKMLQPTTLETDSHYNYRVCCKTTCTLTTVLVAAIWWHCLAGHAIEPQKLIDFMNLLHIHLNY